MHPASPALFPPQCLYSLQSTPVVLSYLSTVDVYILHGTWWLHNTHSVNQHQFNHQSQHTYLQVLHWCLILTKDSTGSYWPTGAKVFPNFCLKLESSLQWQMLIRLPQLSRFIALRGTVPKTHSCSVRN